MARSEKPVVNVSTTDVSVMGETNSTITLTTDKISSNAQVFTLIQESGNAVEGTDYTFAENSAPDYGEVGGRIVIPAFETSGSTTVTGISDFVDGSKSATFKLVSIESMIGIVGNSGSVKITISDFFDPEKLNIYFSWDAPYNKKDFDMVTWSATWGEWGDGGAGSGNPEHDDSIWTADPDGTYYVNVMDWDEGLDFNYHFVILNTNGSIQKINGTFKGTDKSMYTNDIWRAWGGGYDSYRMLKVVKSGSSFTITAL